MSLSEVEKCLSCVLQCGVDIVESVLAIAETAVSEGAGAAPAIKWIAKTISKCAHCPDVRYSLNFSTNFFPGLWFAHRKVEL